MAKKKIKKASKRRLLFFGTLSALIVAYFFFSLGNYMIHIHELKEEQKLLKSQLNELKGNEEELKTELTKLKDKDYLARYARENYLYTKDGEYVIQLKKEEKTTKSTKINTEDYTQYLAIVIVCVFVLMIGYIIYKAIKSK